MADAAHGSMRHFLKDGLLRSVSSLMVKVGAAGLTYLMFVALSRAMGAHEYGQFAFGFALATILSIAAGFGQQTAILRFWQEEEVAGRPELAVNALRAGWTLTLMAGTALALALVALAITIGLGQGNILAQAHLAAAALLILPMGASEYASSALRAQGAVWIALIPRDILWRAAVPLVVWGLYALGLRLDGPQALTLTAALLVLMLVLQWRAGRRLGLINGPGLHGLTDYWRRRGKASLWFWVATIVDSAALNLDTILVGLMVSATTAGIYFNAFRNAGLLTLFMFAITLVIAPIVARHYHAGDMRKAQAITTLCAWAGFVFSLAVFIGFVLFGHEILSLFGPGNEDGYPILIILSIGLMVDAATGPTRIVLMMTGGERAYVAIFGTIMAVGFVFQAALLPLYGVLGAALVNMGARILAQFAIAIYAWRKVGLETTLLGLFVLLRPTRPTPAPALAE